MKLLICAGGTGGGIYPALAVARELQNLGLSREEILWIGTHGEMEEKLVPRTGLHLETITGGPIVGVAPHIRARNAARLASGVGSAARILRRFQPDVMLMTGSYLAIPVVIAAWLRRVPIIIYLPDIEPGRAIRFSLPFARKIACTSASSRAFIPAAKMVVTGYPLRPELRAATCLSRAQALAHFALGPERPALLVFGGSRGARNINRALMTILPQLLAQLQVIHISGELTWPEVETNAGTLPPSLRAYYRPYPYLHEEMGAALRAADLVVARAGASMLGECPAFALPAILVPLTFAWRYQKVNADYLVQQGAAIQLTDEQLPEALLPAIMDLLHDGTKLAQMGAAASALDVPDAAARLAHLIMEQAHKGEAT